MKNKVWFVTGASKGLGLALVKKLLQEDYKVAATSRDVNSLTKVLPSDTKNFLPLQVDLTDKDSIKKAIENTNSAFGGLDVVVNNAGYGIGGAIEELTQKEIFDSFNVNVFAPIWVMQEALNVFRAQGSGYIINISSIAGFNPATGWAMYAATKYALTGMTEVLSQDLEGMNIFATVVAPGGFRTSFLKAESLVYSENKIEDYKAVRASHAKYNNMDGKQLGDPEKAAEVFIELSKATKPPVRLFLGSDSYQRALDKIALLREELDTYKEISSKTDF